MKNQYPSIIKEQRAALVDEANHLLKRLFPIARSITGNGVRESLSVLQETTPFFVHEVPSGTQCFDWTIPDEWNVSAAYVEYLDGERIIDFKKCNVHLVSYSTPIDTVMSFEELAPHLHTLPDLPDAIPYRTSYYSRSWGFCLTHNQLKKIDTSRKFHVVVDSTLKPGSLTYGEAHIKGSSRKEYIISSYCCHPSIANDSLSGVVLWALLLKTLRHFQLHATYRFIVVPETIGAIAYLHAHQKSMRECRGGFVLTTNAGPGQFGYKRSFKGDALIDRAVRATFEENNVSFTEYPFDIHGSDERQFSSPEFRIPTGTITKDKYYEYDYYHTSLDNLDFISAEAIVDSLDLYLQAIFKVDNDLVYRSLNPACEPMLGKRGLYPTIGGAIQQPKAEAALAITPSEQIRAISWLMFYGDGEHSLLDISEKTKIAFHKLHYVAELLCEHKLLEK